MHIHTISLVGTLVECEGCDIALRLATYDEAVFVQMTDGYLDDGPMLWKNGVVVVPLDFSIFQEA